MIRRLYMLCLTACAFGYATPLPAPTPPESYVLTAARTGQNPVDPKLDEWLKTYADAPSIFEAKPGDFQKKVKNLDPVSKAFFTLRYARNTHQSKNQTIMQQALVEARAVVETTDETLKRHLLFPYLVEEWLRSINPEEKDLKFTQDVLKQYGEKSCVQRKTLLREIDLVKPLTLEIARQHLGQIATFGSRKFRQEALRTLLRNLNAEEHGEMAAELQGQMKSFPHLRNEFKWVDALLDGKKEKQQKGEPFVSLDKVKGVADEKNCQNSYKLLLDALPKTDGKQVYLKDVEVAVLRVEGCFRAKSSKERLKFWKDIEEPLTKTFGFHGEELALRRRGLLLWGGDNFDEARLVFKKILDDSKTSKQKAMEARTVYTFARIEENAGNLDAAISYYEQFVNQFKDPKVHEAEHMENALTSLVILYSVSNQLPKALLYADRMIEEDSIKDIDLRSTSGLSFGLYWAGRLNYEMGNSQKAEEYWRRAASEFYSSFYGAIAHFSLEKLVGKALVLQPVRSIPFNTQELYRSFSDKMEQRSVERAMTLLNYGLRDEASCEISELAVGRDEHQKAYLKSLLLYAAGDWFEAIRIYGNLPRSLRNTLPAGSERMLFPKAYTESVLRYSEKLGVDPDYVFAIIRQESVFNPKARSPVGAQGLMQLMPATAKVEAKKLRRDYVTGEARQSIQAGLAAQKIYDPETNLALGVHHVHRLMNIYKSPIFVLTAYNASPRATERWRKNIPTDDVLAFMERIPYRETRAYVKLVLRNYFYYKRWYNSPNEKLAHLELLTSKMEEKKKDQNLRSVDYSL